MMENRIGLYIGGTASSVGGYGDLVSINFDIEKFGIRDISYDYAFNSYYYVVEHTREGILYSYIYNPNAVYAFSSSRAGRLQMNFFIPRGYKLDENLSPLDLIHEVRDTFVGLFMNSYAGKCQFKDVSEFPAEPFQIILDRYGLVPSRRYIPMEGSLDVRCFIGDEEILSRFLQDSQYAEFASYKSIKISTSSNASLEPIPVAVPRIVRYKVFINGRQYGSVDSAIPFNMTCEETGSNSKYCEPVNIRFSLSDVLSGRTIALNNPKAGCAVTSVDENSERIELRVMFPKKEFKRRLVLQPGSLAADKDDILSAFRSYSLHSANKSKPLVIDLDSMSADMSFVGEEIDEEWTLHSVSPSSRFDFYAEFPKSPAGPDGTGSIKVERKFVGIALDRVPDSFYANPPRVMLNGTECSLKQARNSKTLVLMLNLPRRNIANLSLQKSGYSFDSISVPSSPLDPQGYLHIPFPGFRKVQAGSAGNQGNKESEDNYLIVKKIEKDVTVTVWDLGQPSLKISMSSAGNGSREMRIPLPASFKPYKVSFVKDGYHKVIIQEFEQAKQGGCSVKMPELRGISFWEMALAYLTKILPALLIALMLGFGAGLLVQKKTQLLKNPEPVRSERRTEDKDKGLFKGLFKSNGNKGNDNKQYQANNNADLVKNDASDTSSVHESEQTEETSNEDAQTASNAQISAGSGADDQPQMSSIEKKALDYADKITRADIRIDDNEIKTIESWVNNNNKDLSGNESYEIVKEGIVFYRKAYDCISAFKKNPSLNHLDVIRTNVTNPSNSANYKVNYNNLRQNLNSITSPMDYTQEGVPKDERYISYYLNQLVIEPDILQNVQKFNGLKTARKNYLTTHTEWKKR